MGIERRRALEQCIEFELLAQAALARGYLRRPEVAEARKVESVRAFIAAEYAAVFDGPEDVPPADVEAAYRSHRNRFVHPEYRQTYYVRVPVPGSVAPNTEAAERARRAARAIDRAVRHRRGLDPATFLQLARAATDEPLEAETVRWFGKAGLVRPYAEAAWKVPEVGMTSEPVRTPWGWDVILVTGIIPAEDRSLAEATPEIRKLVFAASRRVNFLRWVDALARHHAVVVHESALPRLAAAEPQGREASGP